MNEARVTRQAEGLWTVSAPEHRMLGLKLGTRMTLIRLPDGSLLVHSPVSLSRELGSAIEALGPVAHIVAPNVYHHVYAGEAQTLWPKARFHGARGLERKRRDLRIDSVLDDARSGDFQGALEPVVIDGSLLHETVLVHPATRTVISADLLENFMEMDHLPTRLYLKAAGVWRKPGWSKPLRIVYRDHRAARRSIDALLEHDFDAAVVSHGEPLLQGAKDAVRGTFEFLRTG